MKKSALKNPDLCKKKFFFNNLSLKLFYLITADLRQSWTNSVRSECVTRICQFFRVRQKLLKRTHLCISLSPSPIALVFSIYSNGEIIFAIETEKSFRLPFIKVFYIQIDGWCVSLALLSKTLLQIISHSCELTI